ncbi:sema domain, immunoglobulin domain (Ig), short basic domain, secreted, (semaphorin) 3H isoform X2 [Gadus chalcogrammus]|uniref:sema domain, immunoglobulin domain (Ig), short basic domain, secreted, (semaphorin) 3H isoform X2 n=1 Tax=Gadus chalcogrammus TaxID=1042646 RepID=UPI0024C39712|nr:sema domain, immunoglobulin domain (Ig), short basic domain, secreted, (semaphorin) 3H isoform X2 [Gadus chalcogrammus]
MELCWPLRVVLVLLFGTASTGAWRASQPRLQFTHSELIQNGRLLTLPLAAGDLSMLLPDEDGRRLFVALKDNLLSTSLDDITQNPRKLYWPASPDRVQECLMAGKHPETECGNFLRVLQPYNQTHLYVCGTGAFNPRCVFIATSLFLKSDHQSLSYGQTECGKGKCPYDPHQRTASAVVDGELYAGITSDFMSRDSAFFRSLGNRRVMRTEQYDSTWLHDAQFVRVAPLSETDNPEDDKVYVFFTERAQEAEGAAGKVLYSRVARVCKNDIGGQRSLVNKWSTFQKARLVCSVPGADGLQTHFNQLQDIFILNGKDKKNPLIYGLFTTSSDILNGSAVCVYRMEDMARVFKGNFLHKEGPQYKWAEFTGKVPFPRPGTCPSSTYGSYTSTREYPDDVIFFSRTHPLLEEIVAPLGERPLLVRVGVHYKFTKLVVDRVEAVDGTYDVLYIGTDSGLVLKSIHLPRDDGQSQEITLEELQVFKLESPVTAMTLSKKKWLFVGSREGLSQLALYQCELYGQACAECCLARDPYCTWDGHACSPYMPVARRRNARHLGQEEDPLKQCVRQGAGLHVEAEQRAMMVAEGNSTYLECLPRSRHAAVTWYKQAGENSPELHKVVSGDQLVLFERGVLIRRAELSHGGVYHCQLEEHGFLWTAVTFRLSVWSSSANHVITSWSEPTNQHTAAGPGAGQGSWYQDVMPLIHPGDLGQHCRALGYRPPRNHRHHGDLKKSQRQKHGAEEGGRGGVGGRGGGGRGRVGGGGGGRGGGRKSRSKPQLRAPRSA